MSALKQFERELNRLYEDKTYELRHSVGLVKRGKPPTFNKARRKKSINRLLDLASRIRDKKVAEHEFNRLVVEKRRWYPKRGKGRGVDEKKRRFSRWFESEILHTNYIYIFWSGRKCTYVGRSTHGKMRPQSHFVKFWFPGVTCIDVWSTSRRSEVPKLECLAIHRFNPTRNRRRAADKKWTKKCPICEFRQFVRNELRRIFRLRY